MGERPNTKREGRVSPPERLTARHDVSRFCNGKHPSLDEWLRHRALAGEGLSARTYVICDAEDAGSVVGYYAICAAMEQRAVLPSAKLRRAMPDQIPLLLIARLAVAQNYRGRGLGTELLADALKRCLSAAEIVGARAVAAHAIDDEAVAFYHRHGFVVSPLGERVMLMPMETVRALVGE